MMKKIASAVMAGVMALSLAACGGSNTGSSSSAASQTSTASGTEAAYTVIEDGKLHMATNAAFPPYEMTKDDGGFEGIDVEIATAIAEKLGLELVVDNMDFSSVITAVQGGKADIAMAGLTVTEERKQNLDFTESYATSKQVIITNRDSSNVQTVDDLEGAMIGCQEGTTGYIYCSDDVENGGYGADHVIGYETGALAVQALVEGKVDCVVIDSEPAKQYVAANEDQLHILDTEFVEEEYAIGVSKDNPGLTEAVNNALKELIDSGKVQEIVDSYISA